jgi:hypothetical protein
MFVTRHSISASGLVNRQLQHGQAIADFAMKCGNLVYFPQAVAFSPLLSAKLLVFPTGQPYSDQRQDLAPAV